MKYIEKCPKLEKKSHIGQNKNLCINYNKMAGGKKNYRKKRGRGKTTKGTIYRPVSQFGPLGKSYVATLKYSETVLIDAPTGKSGDHIFSANGIAKPDQTSVPLNLHQPYGHDQLVNFYDHYTVIGSKCVISSANNITFPIYVGCALRDNAAPINATANILRESGGTQLRLMSRNDGGHNKATIVQTFSPRKFFGKARGNIVGESELRGTMAPTASDINNPAEQAYYHCLVVPQNDVDNPPVQVLQVDIYYTVVFTEPKVLITS